MLDFAVIGGGIAGLSSGARLARHGRVLVLEMETGLAYHASGRSAAMFEQQYGLPSTVALNKASAEYHATANGGVLSPRGLMLLGKSEEQSAFDHDRLAMGLQQISARDAQDLFPLIDSSKDPLVAHHEDAWDIDTDLLMQNFARDIRARGGQIRTKARVTALARTQSGWRVETEDADLFETRNIVNAAGPWVDQIAAMAGITPIGIQPLRRSMARIPVPDGMNPARWPMIFGTGETWYAKPDAGALIVSPADEDPQPPMDAWADDMVLAEGLARFEDVMDYEVTQLLSNWAGLRSFAPDRQLVLGPDPADPSFIWSAGQGGYGFQTAPAASQLVADLVSGARSELDDDVISKLRPDRLR